MYVKRPSPLLKQYPELEWGLTHIDPKLDDNGNFAFPIAGDPADPRNLMAAQNHRVEMRRLFENPNWSVLLKPEDSTHVFRLIQDSATLFTPFDTSRTRGMDGAFTNIPRLMICLLLCDNQPIIIYDPKQQVIGLASANWNNSLGDSSGTVVSHLVMLMNRQYGCRPEDLAAYLGPTLCADHNDLPVSEATRIQPFIDRWQIQPARFQKGQRLYVDISETNYRLLRELGVTKIDKDERCTFDTDYLASAKRDDKRLGGPYRPTAAVAVMLKMT